MTIKYLMGCAVLVTALGACSKKSGGGGADIDAFMKLDTDKAAAFSVGGDDCTAKAKSVGDWRKAHAAEYKAMRKKLNDQWPNGTPKDVQAKYGLQMANNKKAVMDATITCVDNDAFSKMMDETKTAD